MIRILDVFEINHFLANPIQSYVGITADVFKAQSKWARASIFLEYKFVDLFCNTSIIVLIVIFGFMTKRRMTKRRRQNAEVTKCRMTKHRMTKGRRDLMQNDKMQNNKMLNDKTQNDKRQNDKRQNDKRQNDKKQNDKR